MPRLKATNKTTGETISFDWSGSKRPTPEDIEKISDQQRTSRIAAKEKIANIETPSLIDRILTSSVTGAALKGADWLGLDQHQFLEPRENLSNIGEGTKQIFTGEGSEENPRIAGLNKVVKGAWGIGGLPLTALGYASGIGPAARTVGPIARGLVPMATGMLAGHAAGAGTQAILPDNMSPEGKELASTGASLLAGGAAGHYASRMMPQSPITPPPQSPGTAVGRPIYGRPQPPVDNSTIMNMGPTALPPGQPPPSPTMPRQMPPATYPIERNSYNPTVAPPVEAPPLNPEVLPPFNYSAGRPGLAPGQTPAQIPARGTPIEMPPASIPMPSAGSFARRQMTEQTFGNQPRQIEAPKVPPQQDAALAPTEEPTVSAPEEAVPPQPEPKGAAVQPPAPIVRSPAEQTLTPELEPEPVAVKSNRPVGPRDDYHNWRDQNFRRDQQGLWEDKTGQLFTDERLHQMHDEMTIDVKPIPEQISPSTPKQIAPAPVERKVVQDMNRDETLKPEVASTLAVGSTRVNSKGGVETLQDVPLDKIDPTPGNELYPQGNKIYPNKVQQYVKEPSQVGVELRNRGDRFETYEGHHRIEAAKQRGDKSILSWTSETGPDNLPLPRGSKAPEPPAAPTVPPQEPQVRAPQDIARAAIQGAGEQTTVNPVKSEGAIEPKVVAPGAKRATLQNNLSWLNEHMEAFNIPEADKPAIRQAYAEYDFLKRAENGASASDIREAKQTYAQLFNKNAVDPKQLQFNDLGGDVQRFNKTSQGYKPEEAIDVSSSVQAPPIKLKSDNSPTEILDYIKRRVSTTPAQIQNQFGLAGDKVNSIMLDLKKQGLVNVKGGKFTAASTDITVKPPEEINQNNLTVKPPEETRSEPSKEPQVVSPLIGKGRLPEGPNKPTNAPISAKPAISAEKETSPETIEKPDLLERLKGGTKKQQQIAAEVDNVNTRLDQLETKEDSKEGLTEEETNERNGLYRKLNKLEKDGEYSLKPDVDKYGPRVANMRSLHAEAKLGGISHEDLSERAKDDYGVSSMSLLTHEQLAELEGKLKTERMEGESETVEAPSSTKEKPKGVFNELSHRIDELESKEETQKLSPDEESELKEAYKRLSKLEKQRGSISFRPLGRRRPSDEPSRFGTFLHKFNGIINSEDIFLEQKPETRPVADIIHNAQVRGDHFEYFWSRRYNNSPDKTFVRQQLASFVESRGLTMGDIRPAGGDFRDLLHNVKSEIYDRPATTRAREIIKDLPDGFDKDRAKWYVDNWSKVDLRSEGHRFFKELDSTAASVGARSVLFGSTDLQLLHTARLASQVWPELGTADTFKGLTSFVKDPTTAWKEAVSVGLMPQQKMPWGMKTKMEKFDSIGNFLDFGNSVVKAITYQAMKAKYPDDLMKAVRETKRVEGVVGRESPIYALEKTPKTVYQFKYWLFKYIGGIANAAREGEMGKVGRYITAAVMLEEMTRRLGVKLYHLRASTMFSGGSPSLRKAQNITTHLSKGQFDKAGKDVVTAMPGGSSLLPTAQKLIDGDFEGAFSEFMPLEKSH